MDDTTPPASASDAPWFRVGASEVRLLRDGAMAYPAMLQAIESAQREVLAEFYWITPDAVGDLFREALVERANAGVVVRVIYDSLGSVGLSMSWWRPLLDAGGMVWEYHSLPFALFVRPFRLENLIQRDHRKLLVVDGSIGFTGGINLGLPWQSVDRGGGGWTKYLQFSVTADAAPDAGPGRDDRRRRVPVGQGLHSVHRLGEREERHGERLVGQIYGG